MVFASRAQNCFISFIPISLLEEIGRAANLSSCFFLARLTRWRTDALSSATFSEDNLSNFTGGTSICKSILSRSGPEIFRLYFKTWAGEHWQSRAGSVNFPQGQGFIAATSIKRAGKLIARWARATEIIPSSSGWRSASRTWRLNSGNSSRNKTPRWDNVISPGFGTAQPPTKATADAV